MEDKTNVVLVQKPEPVSVKPFKRKSYDYAK